ncbi:hypothetical protein Acr_15g0003980 [Actinidia rufa]|uniref:Uncharacterized protein n=1 Tax=Actinidia rufa TaxID=165716 RepID=A0A7J0FSV4_9ERIC|nr:hypothetical protein Acr_15g0003980 [Actinidia rufa]
MKKECFTSESIDPCRSVAEMLLWSAIAGDIQSTPSFISFASRVTDVMLNLANRSHMAINTHPRDFCIPPHNNTTLSPRHPPIAAAATHRPSSTILVVDFTVEVRVSVGAGGGGLREVRERKERHW